MFVIQKEENKIIRILNLLLEKNLQLTQFNDTSNFFLKFYKEVIQLMEQLYRMIQILPPARLTLLKN
jgi:hypothetical protein